MTTTHTIATASRTRPNVTKITTQRKPSTTGEKLGEFEALLNKYEKSIKLILKAKLLVASRLLHRTQVRRRTRYH